MKKLDNKGITLVELVIAIGIFAVVMVAMMSVLNISSKTFSKGNDEINVQNEATAFMNQMENIISESKYGVYVKKIGTDDLCMISMYDDSFTALVWKKADREVYVKTFTTPDGSIKSSFALNDDTDKNGTYAYKLVTGFVASPGFTKDNLLAEDVESLGFVANNEYGYVSVYITVKHDKGQTSFSAAKNVSIRNISKGVVSANSTTKYKNYYGGDTDVIEDVDDPGSSGGSGDSGDSGNTSDVQSGVSGSGVGTNTTPEATVTYNFTVKLTNPSAAESWGGCNMVVCGNYVNISFSGQAELSGNYSITSSVYNSAANKAPFIAGSWGCGGDANISIEYGVVENE